MSERNSGTELDVGWILKVNVNQPAVLRRADQIQTRRTVKKEWQAAWLLRAVTCIDLTTLSGDDTPSNIHRLCYKAKQPIRDDLLQRLNVKDLGITTGAVCVYPARVHDAVCALKEAGCSIPVASVATGFPAGQTPLKTRLEEVRLAVEDGASEIDIVINRTLVLTGQWEGSDFIKTSTGKESVNATYPVALVMVRAIRDFYWKLYKVGLQTSGGGSAVPRKLSCGSLIIGGVGDEWLNSDLFRLW
ncbi:hypothetical protein GDO86_004904 [Hymenochirus boettgeri]|uniref:deoxyribose-phosphate aldolase n=1 Tax=Hymenochirus boettgeri TaxID=247094 RepID=A0A8T2J403_9PIPI|nr:hypothetical protein GDO86_004904 [Hymenochirus boettgeri]